MFGTQARGALRERNILEGSVESKSDIGYFRPLVVQSDSYAPDIEDSKNPRSRRRRSLSRIVRSFRAGENLPERFAKDKRAAFHSESVDGLVFDKTFEIKFRANEVKP